MSFLDIEQKIWKFGNSLLSVFWFFLSFFWKSYSNKKNKSESDSKCSKSSVYFFGPKWDVSTVLRLQQHFCRFRRNNKVNFILIFFCDKKFKKCLRFGSVHGSVFSRWEKNDIKFWKSSKGWVSGLFKTARKSAICRRCASFTKW